jgi:hypothetical protein
MIGFQSSILAGTVLVRSAIRSPNYIAGVSGWTINQDGSCEFNNAVIRGSIIAGGGTVRLDAGGVKVDGTLLQFDINASGGFLARRLPDDGGYGQLTMAESTAGSTYGGGVFLNPTDPTPTNGNTYDLTGALWANTLQTGAVDTPETVMRSPGLTGKARAYVRANGQTSASGVDNTEIQLVSASTTIEGDLSVGGIGHKEYVPYPGPTVVTNSTVPFNITGTVLTLEAGCTYTVALWAAYNGPLAADARWSWAKTHASITGNRNIIAPAITIASNEDTNMVAIRRADATQELTGTPNTVVSAFTVYQEFGIWDNAAATDESIQLQFAQGVANATGCTLQAGYLFLERVA